MDYDEMIDRARKGLPKSVFKTERFEIPKVLGHLQGNKTVISNFNNIVATLRRPLEHVMKYLLKELATPGEMQGNLLILGTKVPSLKINDKIQQYAKSYVLCKECGKPDTQIIKEGDFNFLRCQACGAKAPVKGKI